MAGDKREVRVAVVGDAAQLQRELLKAEGQLSGFGNNAKKSGDILRNALFGGAVLYGAKKLVDAAGELQQSVGGTAAVFEDASGAVNEFTKNSADLVGMSENASRTITSRLGASLKGFGMSTEEAAAQAINLTKTGADLAATLGGKTDDAVGALGSALRGEYDPLERFGIALKASEVNAKAVSMGLADSETDVTAYAKGQATLALITERSAFAQGQFAREADTAQGQAQRAQAKTEDAAASLGKSLLPVYTKIQETIGFVADAFSALPGPAQTAVIGFAGVIAIGPSIVEGFKLAMKAVSTLVTAVLDAGAKAVSTQGAIASMNISTQAAGSTAAAAAGGMSLLGPAVLAVGAAAVVGGIAYKNYKDEQAAVKKDIDALIPTFDKLTGAMTANTQTTVGAILASKNQLDNLNKAGITVSQFSDVLDDNRDALISQSDAEALARGDFAKGSIQYERRIKALKEAGGAQNELILRLIETESADVGLIQTLYNGIDAYNEQQEVIRQLNIQKGLNEGKTLDQAEAEADLAAEVENSKEQIDKLIKSTKDLNDTRISNEEAEINSRKAVKEYNDALANGGLTVDERRTKELDLIKTLEDQAETFAELVVAQKLAKGESVTSGEAALVQSRKLAELAATLAPDSPVRKHLQGLAYDLLVVASQDPVVKIRIETEEAIRKFREFLRVIGADENAPGLAEILQYSSDYIEPRAGGGPVGAGMPYLVGEKGPELFVPSGYGRIIDAFSTNKALLSNAGGSMGGSGGGNVTINVTVSPTADKASIGQTIVEAISSYERRSGPGWRL
jgi:hypothetical protein